FFIISTAALARAQTPPASPPSGDKPERLDKFVVSAGPDPKTSFDLAQGTSVLTGDDLRRLAQATLGETLTGTPGVNSTSYGPGSSRPVIRGLGGDRIRVLDNGIGALDASNVSPDHNTALEPLFASSIEVLRGPSTLLYGSSAVGGVVNVIGNSLPHSPPEEKLSGTLELRGGGAAGERTGAVSAGGGNKSFAIRVNALKTKTRDVHIPGVARIDADAPSGQPTGILPNSAVKTWSGSVGATAFGNAGHVGAVVSRYETEYGVPTGDDPPISIKMRQARLDLEGEIAQPFGPFRSGKARFGFGDYDHTERSGGATVNTAFKNKAWEGRVELPHLPLGPVTGIVGAQMARSDFAAVGEEVVTPPSRTQSAAVFGVEELKLGAATTLQFGGRVERQTIILGGVDPDLPQVPGYRAHSGQKKVFAGVSVSTGVVFHPAKDWSVGANLAYTERLPTAQELFSNGPHGGTGAYEVGTTGLGAEKSFGFDVSVRRRAGFVTGALSAFVNRFDNYIFQEQLPPEAIPAGNNEETLTPFQYVARAARFYGGEAEFSFHLLHEQTRDVHFDLMADYVRADETNAHTPLPRIPPRRYAARLGYADGGWSGDIELRLVARQNRFAAGETSTPSYTLVNANAGYLIVRGRMSYELFARAQNLGDVDARAHTSFLKEFAPLPGRSVTVGVRANF
ncbi:MAG: TonB-dependent receptor, partial [Opitutaceae bacterium]